MKKIYFIFYILMLSFFSNIDAECSIEKYAVLFNGGYQSSYNYAAYYNDMRQMYDVLLNIYEFPEEHIIILQSDGQNSTNDLRFKYANGSNYYVNSAWDLDTDGDYDIESGAATSQNLFAEFTALSSIIDSDDLFYFWATGHGANDPGVLNASLAGWNSTLFSDANFASAVSSIIAGTEIYVFGQCYSGAFIDNLTGQSNAIIVTACDSEELSWTWYNTPTVQYQWGTYTNNTGDRSLFLKEWAKALSGYADYNSDGEITMFEAFYYAEHNDYTGPYGAVPKENPKYNDIFNIGGLVTLNNWEGSPVPEHLFPVCILAIMVFSGFHSSHYPGYPHDYCLMCC
ncbi:peptidase C13 family protein [Candidatus Omnitrophus magneticus]|uniref:Peptidase C13 family protein n=1 Tax=Candidatus Omnitrophus magneticus TaxID=1609969 RepID=A0A0F0CPJ8_9BACT|nr:peptidase C13 family protein [Candidatus Omnitrophus magneticus]